MRQYFSTINYLANEPQTFMEEIKHKCHTPGLTSKLGWDCPTKIFWSKIRLHGLLLLDLVPPPPPPQHTRLAPQSWFPLGLLSPATKDRFGHNYQRKLMFENLGCVLLNPWNGFHHDLLLLPGAASTRRGATFSFLSRAALLSPHQGGCSRDSKAEEVNISIEIEVWLT